METGLHHMRHIDVADRLQGGMAPSEGGYDLEALVPVDVDGDGVVEMAVVGQYMTGAGPQGAIPFTEWSVVTWDGTKLGMSPELAAKVEAVWNDGSPAGAKARLRKKYGVP